MDLINNQEEESHLPLDIISPNMRLESSSHKERRRKWSPTEDIVLCNSWLNTSKDSLAVGNNEHKLKSFWKRIASYYNASPKLKGFEKRELGKCKQRWHKINDSVCKFLGSYEAAMRQKSSGRQNNDDDVLKVAYEIFFNDHKVKFNLEHAWIELRNNHKWRELGQVGGGSKKRKVDDQSSSSIARPEGGVKASSSKAKGKRNVVEVDSEEQSETTSSLMWAIKEKDLALREKLWKHKLLNSLLARKQPLSELESALKDKLITDMLNN